MLGKKKPLIVVVGSANVDLTTFTDQFPRPGETVFGDHFDLGFGGKGANQAVATSYCGAEAHMVARVGDDLFGTAAIKNLRSLGVRAKYVKSLKGVSTGVAPIFVDSSGQNRILVVKGANNELTPRAITDAVPLLKRAKLIIVQFEIPMETNYRVVTFAKRNGIPCIMNPAPACPVELERVSTVRLFHTQRDRSGDDHGQTRTRRRPSQGLCRIFTQ